MGSSQVGTPEIAVGVGEADEVTVGVGVPDGVPVEAAMGLACVGPQAASISATIRHTNCERG